MNRHNFILGDPGADSWGEGKSKRATKKISEEKSSPRSRLFFADNFVARLDFPSPQLSAPRSPRMIQLEANEKHYQVVFFI